MLSAKSKGYMANFILHQELKSGDSESSASCTISGTNEIQRKQCRTEWNHFLLDILPFYPRNADGCFQSFECVELENR